jgi:hypothetical protein
VLLPKVLAVPEFGPTNSQGLLQWRKRLEALFVYSEKENDVDRQELTKIATSIQTKASQLRRTLLAGPANLKALIAREKSLADVKDPELARNYGARLQSWAGLQYLKVPKSVVDQRAVAQRSTQMSQAIPPPYSRAQTPQPAQARVT